MALVSLAHIGQFQVLLKILSSRLSTIKEHPTIAGAEVLQLILSAKMEGHASALDQTFCGNMKSHISLNDSLFTHSRIITIQKRTTSWNIFRIFAKIHRVGKKTP